MKRRDSHLRSASPAELVKVRYDATDPRPWLNEPIAVGAVIERFSRDVIAMLGKVDQDEFSARLEFYARAVNTVFIGPDTPSQRFSRGPWNTPDQLGMYLQFKLDFIAADSRLILRDGLTIYAARLLLILSSSMSEAPEHVGARLREAAMQMRDVLLGRDVPSPLWPPSAAM